MTTGFTRFAVNIHTCVAAALIFAATATHAADISVNALFSGKAVVIVDGGKPRSLSVGESTPEGVKLLSATSEAAVVEYNGRRRTLSVGEGTRVVAAPPRHVLAQTTILADSRGHFYAMGQVNGKSVRFMIDTGATAVALSGTEAQALGINYRSGRRGLVNTANGVIPVYLVSLDSVRIGEISLTNVEAMISEGPQHVALLGMSFLNRTQMRHDGGTLTLAHRF